jgi:hypothetical protein
LHPPQKLQRPENFPVCVAYLSTDVDNFHHAKVKTFCLASFLEKKKKLAIQKVLF